MSASFLIENVGWNRSASNGLSVWGGSSRMDRTRSEPSTAPGSPVDSDDEEYEADVDYDDVGLLIPPWVDKVLIRVGFGNH